MTQVCCLTHIRGCSLLVSLFSGAVAVVSYTLLQKHRTTVLFRELHKCLIKFSFMSFSSGYHEARADELPPDLNYHSVLTKSSL